MKNGEMSGRRIVSDFGEDRSIICEGMAEATFYPSGKSAPQAPVSGTAPLKGAAPINGTAPASTPAPPNGTSPINSQTPISPVGAGVTPVPTAIPVPVKAPIFSR